LLKQLNSEQKTRFVGKVSRQLSSRGQSGDEALLRQDQFGANPDDEANRPTTVVGDSK
jgi:hypothetical protein